MDRRRREAVAKEIGEEILKDLRSRRGFRQVWDECYPEDQREIINTWIRIAEVELDKENEANKSLLARFMDWICFD